MQVANASNGRNMILLAVNIASQCGQAISMNEIALMLPQPVESTDVQETLQTDSCISKSVSVEDGFAVIKGYEHLFSERRFREKTSKNLRVTAETFIRELRRRKPCVELMAICGSVAYGSAKDSDDIDLFILSKENRMWFTFFKSLLLARVFNLKAIVSGARADFCLSYMQDKKNFEEEITKHKNPLFAREFLSLHVVDGMSCYLELLEKTRWMSDVFPRLYASRKFNHSKDGICGKDFRQRLQAHNALNLFIYASLGGFLRLKALLRNLKFRKQGKMKDVFEANITMGSCVYTSKRYRELENLYNSSYSLGENFCSNLNQAKN